MTKRQFTIIAICLAIILIFLWNPLAKEFLPTDNHSTNNWSRRELPFNTSAYFESNPLMIFNLEIARTERERADGLMFVEEINDNQGMLFVFEEENPRSFWMKNTYISLDILFLDKDLRVVKIIENLEPLREWPYYNSDFPAKYALELKAGAVEKNSLEIGDELYVKF